MNDCIIAICKENEKEFYKQIVMVRKPTPGEELYLYGQNCVGKVEDVHTEIAYAFGYEGNLVHFVKFKSDVSLDGWKLFARTEYHKNLWGNLAKLSGFGGGRLLQQPQGQHQE